MSARRARLISAIVSALMAAPVYAQTADIQTQLVEQGHYWQARSNSQREAEVWQKVLLLNPDQVDALYGMGLIGVRQNQPGQAQEYLARLQALSPPPWQARQLEQDIALMAPGKQALLEEARQLVDAGERDQASVVFDQVLGDLTPQGAIGGEYYDNLASNPDSWPEARRGLERLMHERPEDARIALIYAKQLIRHKDSRAEGVRLLSRLSQHADIAGEADESWRQALVWMGPPDAAQVPLFQDFLRVHPDDQDIRALLNRSRPRAQAGGRPYTALVASGLRALERGDRTEAENAFLKRLATHPGDPDALGGLGVVRQQQNRHIEAEHLLTRALSQGGNQWQAALDSVRYWALLQQARDLQANGEITRAEDAVRQAMHLNPDLPDGRLALADLQAQAGQYANASANYRQVLAAQPGHPQALSGLIDVLAQSGQADQALRLLDRLSPEEQAEFGDAGRLRTLRWAQLARVAEERGDLAAAQEALQEALREDPDNVWTHYHLARLHVRSGAPHTAREQMETLLATDPDNAEALYASAMLLAELEQWQAAQEMIDRIPGAQRTPAMDALAHQILLGTHIRQALTLARNGQRQDALDRLDRLQALAAERTEHVPMLASAYADAGDAGRALAMLRGLMQSRTPSIDLMLHYAAILLKIGEDAQVQVILSGLEDVQMSVTTREHYDDMRYLYRVRQAERLREEGDLEAAYNMLAPALAQRPDDVTATATLARIHASGGDNARALAVYKPLARRNPDDPGVLLGAANAAVLMRDHAYAGRTLAQLLTLQDTDTAALTEAARLYRALGKPRKAMALLRRVIAIEQRQTPRVQSAHRDAGTGPGMASASPAIGFTVGFVSAAPVLSHAALTHSDPVAMEHPRPVQTAAHALPRAQAMQAGDGASPARRMLNEIQRAHAAFVTQGVNIRSTDSESGLGKLSDVEHPLTANVALGDGRLVLGITPVRLDAGRMSDQTATRFGGGGASAMGVGAQRDEGVGISIAYTRPVIGFKADIGTTPIGFKYRHVVVGVSIGRPLNGNPRMYYRATLSRRAVTDSLTAFSGARDLREGLSWGGVTANGGRVQLGYDDGKVGVYGAAALHRLLGHNVTSNTRSELGVGVYRHVHNAPDRKLTVGLGATALGYANNQGFYTYGHGGYFSPKTYLALGVPVTWAQRSDRFTYLLKGSIGVQSLQQSGADYFPTDVIRQAASGQRYAGQRSRGLSYGLETAGEYRLGRKLFVGGAFALDNSRNYRQTNAGMYLRYLFEDMTGAPLALPVSPYRSPYLDD